MLFDAHHILMQLRNGDRDAIALESRLQLERRHLRTERCFRIILVVSSVEVASEIRAEAFCSHGDAGDARVCVATRSPQSAQQRVSARDARDRATSRPM